MQAGLQELPEIRRREGRRQLTIELQRAIVGTMNTINLDNFVTTKAASELMGVHQRYVRTLAEKGRLPFVRFGSDILIDKRAACSFVRDPLGRGKPAKTAKRAKAKARSKPGKRKASK